jgi:hypothetical protein
VRVHVASRVIYEVGSLSSQDVQMGSEDDTEDTSATKARNLARVRLLMFLTFVLVVAFMAVLIFGMATNVRWEEEWLVGGSTVPEEEFKPMDIRVLPYPYWAALEETNRQLEEMELGNISKVDPDSHEFEAHLILDYESGSIMYWRFDDGDIEVDFDAYSGEIIAYYNYGIMGYPPGNLSEEEVLNLSEAIAEQFAPIPSDASEPTAKRIRHHFIPPEKLNETIKQTEDYDWRVWYVRLVDEIVADDTLSLDLLEDGTLTSYYKVWWMDLEDLDTEYTVTREEAIETALDAFGKDLIMNSCEKRVVRPNNEFGDQKYWGTPPMSVWTVRLSDGTLFVYGVEVHPRKADTIVGGIEAMYD